MTRGYADLHLHTVASDGTISVAEQIRRAKAAALSCISTTDHDVISDDITERVTTIDGVELVAGVEIKADFDGIAGEILGYFFDPKHEKLRTFLQGMGAARVERMEEMIKRCREELDIEVDLADVRAVAAGNLGRPHLARVLVNKGVVAGFSEAFGKLLRRGAPCYAPIDKAGFREVVQIVREAGGVTSLAHPCLMKVDEWDTFLDELLAGGVDGLETVYPYDPSGRSLTVEPALLRRMAEKRGFLETGGSDDHGPDSTKESIGTIRLPYDRVETLRSRAGER